MSTSHKSARNLPIVSDTKIRDALRTEIQLAISVQHRFTRASLAQQSGVSTDTIDAIISRDENKHRRLKIDEAFSLAAVLGTRSVNALLAVISYGAYHLDETGEPDLAEIVASGIENFSIIARALADGVIEPHEERETADAADALIDTVTPISNRRLRA